MNDQPSDPHIAFATTDRPMHEALNSMVNGALPQSPEQFGTQLIRKKWGENIDPQTAQLVTLDYHYRGHPPQDGVEQGQVASSQTLVQALLSNYLKPSVTAVSRKPFSVFNTPPDVGLSIRIVQNVDEFADHGNGNHHTYEGIYRANRAAGLWADHANRAQAGGLQTVGVGVESENPLSGLP